MTIATMLVVGAIVIGNRSYGCSVYGSDDGRDRKAELIRSSSSIRVPRQFSEETLLIPPNYTGLDPYLAWKILRRSQAPKGEYETTEQYEKRKNLLVPYVIKYGYNTAHPLPFVTDITENSVYTELEYDADNRVLNFILRNQWASGQFEITVQSRFVKESYIGSNAFGVTRKVTALIACGTRIHFPFPRRDNEGKTPTLNPTAPYFSQKIYDITSTDTALVVGIPATPQQAQQIKGKRLSILYVFTPTAPYVQEDRVNYREATVADPTSTLITTHIITGSLKGVLIVERFSGRVLGSRFFVD